MFFQLQKLWIKSRETDFGGLSDPRAGRSAISESRRRTGIPARVAWLLISVAGLLWPACGDPGRDARLPGDTPDGATRSFEIRVGERVRDWCERVGRDSSPAPALAAEAVEPRRNSGSSEGAGAFDCAAVRRSAGRLQFSEPRFAFVPPPVERLNRFEGLFVPGRYTRGADESVDALIRRLLEATARRLERSGIDAAEYNIPGLEFDSYRQLILASIVEKEAASNRGYEGVAAVFLNRLRDNEVLGSCPTVEYALGYHRPFLLFKDLELKSPYNVYKRRGLPPTPIAFFSDEAFDAVRRPVDSAAYFFVFDWTTGDLIFADDYGAHKRNAAGARKRFIAQFGKETIYKRYDGLFYEMPAEDAPEWAIAH